MTDIAIRAEGLGKKYRLGGPQARYKTLRESLIDAVTGPVRALGAALRGERRGANGDNIIWALKDVSFEVKHGEVVGVIGRNGAGKSTLLKVLTRITEPTEGYAEINGRVGSLLEVGTGFHPELTGRENIYLSGAILGMKKAEIDRKFDEIVDFSGVERFLDTPVKHYSSGMQVRLGFAVAAHLDPEILLIDEVLAVGDAEFQRKCLGKMEGVAKEGRTVLFVSHNMTAVTTLCNNGLLLDRGHIIARGDTDTVVSQYVAELELNAEYQREHGKNETDRKLVIERASIMKGGKVSTTFNNSEILTLRIETFVSCPIYGAQIAFEFLTAMNECLFSSTSQDSSGKKTTIEPGHYVFECSIDLRMFREGRYHIKVASSVPGVEILDVLESPLAFELHEDYGPVLALGQGRRGLILPILNWEVTRVCQQRELLVP